MKKLNIARFCILTVLVVSLLSISNMNTALARHTLGVGDAFDCSAQSYLNPSECEALKAFYQSTGGDHWTKNDGWLVNADPCTWYGVICYVDPDKPYPWVYYMQLSNNNLNGPFPAVFGTTTWEKLKYVDLSFNNLTSNIPQSFGDAPWLRYLMLEYNQLTGSIPANLGKAPQRLSSLLLCNNRLSGAIPATMFISGSYIDSLLLQNNQFSGNIPDSIRNVTYALPGNVDLSNNMLTVDTANKTLVTWLNTNVPGWDATQTVAPTNLSAIKADDNTLKIFWTPITYQADAGYYEVGYRLGGSSDLYTFDAAFRTASKADRQLLITSLDFKGNYEFVVRTVTAAHGEQANTLTSLNSPSMFYLGTSVQLYCPIIRR